MPGSKIEKHVLPDCMLVWLNPCLHPDVAIEEGDEICHQGWADIKWSGFNSKIMLKIRYPKRKKRKKRSGLNIARMLKEAAADFNDL